MTRVGCLDGTSALNARFAAASSRPQLLALVSPTCEVCLDGVGIILQGLREPLGQAFEAHVVWTPVLAGDTRTAAREVADTRQAQHVTHYWDDTGSISEAARIVLDLSAWDRTVAWDVYLLYRGDVAWRDPLPTPTAWLHQLRIEGQPSLDADSLRRALQALAS